MAGGAGVYSFWLASLGHRVHLLDLAKNHIDIARAHGDEVGVALDSYTCADARFALRKREYGYCASHGRAVSPTEP